MTPRIYKGIEYFEVTAQDASSIIEERKPLGLFLRECGRIFVGIDNRDGDAWTEDFKTKRRALSWLISE